MGKKKLFTKKKKVYPMATRENISVVRSALQFIFHGRLNGGEFKKEESRIFLFNKAKGKLKLADAEKLKLLTCMDPCKNPGCPSKRGRLPSDI